MAARLELKLSGNDYVVSEKVLNQLKMIPSKAVIVVAPGYPPELIKELLSARILPLYLDLAVLLPPERAREYDLLMQRQKFYGVRFLRSPGRRFFSTTHLSWLLGEMKSKYVMLLVSKSTFQDIACTIVSLSRILWSCKTIALLRATEVTAKNASKSDENRRDIDTRWLITEINAKNITEEFRRIMRKIRRGTWWTLYYLMFVGLIMRRSWSVSVSPLVHKLRSK